jgi:hypothetical protein
MNPSDFPRLENGLSSVWRPQSLVKLDQPDPRMVSIRRTRLLGPHFDKLKGIIS